MRVGVRIVMLILSGFFPSLEMWARVRQKILLSKARVKGVGDMFVAPPLWVVQNTCLLQAHGSHLLVGLAAL